MPVAFDAELALPSMAMELLPPYLVGLILAGIFTATMSTADSLLLSCSAALTHDLLPHRIEHTWLLKLATALITLAALGWALLNQQSVFNLVIMAWSGLASAFAPLLIVCCAWAAGPRGACAATAALVTGFTVVLTLGAPWVGRRRCTRACRAYWPACWCWPSSNSGSSAKRYRRRLENFPFRAVSDLIGSEYFGDLQAVRDL